MYIGTTKITDWSTWVVVLRSKKYARLQIIQTVLKVWAWFVCNLNFVRVLTFAFLVFDTTSVQEGFLCWCFKSLGSPSWVDYCCDEARGPMKGEPYGSNKRKTFKVANYAWTMHDLAYERCLSCMHNNCKIQGKYRPNNSWL